MYQQNKELFSIPRLSVFAGIIIGFLYLPPAYLLFHQKKVFILPIHCGLKMTAWMFGFMKGQLRLK